MRFAVFTASTPEWTPEEAVARLAAQGWDGVEWRVTDQEPADPPGFWAGNRCTVPFTGFVEAAETLGRLTREAGLACSGIGGYRQVTDRDGVAAMLEGTARAGAHRVRLTMPGTGDGTDHPALAAAARAGLEAAVPAACELGVQVLVELHHETITPSASAARRLVEGLDPAVVGVIHDLGNLVIEGREHLASALQILGPYLAHVHVKNARWVDTGRRRPDGSAVWAHEWAPLAAGQADVGGYLRTLRAHGYDGWVTVEDFSTDLPLEERLAADLALLAAA